MSINLVTYANQTVTPTNDAIIYERAIDQNGIFYGCNVTVSSNEVHITGGYGIVCGREFTIQSEAIAVTLAPSGTLDGRLYVRLDLADADAPIQLLTATGNTLPPLEQDSDVNYTNGAYEMELATFTVGVSALSDVVETYETIMGTRSGIGRKVLYDSVKVSSGTLTLNDAYTNYDFLVVSYFINADRYTRIFDCGEIATHPTNNFHGDFTIYANGSTVYSSTCSFKPTDGTHLAISNSGNNGNFVAGIVKVVGVKIPLVTV